MLRPALLVLLAALAAGTSARAGAAPTEAEVKAAFLVSFARFVTWPEDAAGGLIILEPDPVAEAASRQAASARSLPIDVQLVRTPSQAAPARILFAGRQSGTAGLEALRAAGPSVLTVGETEDFLQRGGIVRLAIEDGRVRVEINVDAAERSRLRLSSQLMKVARLRRESEWK